VTRHPETDLVHKPIMDLVRMHEGRYPALITGLIHVPNEGKRTQAQHGFLVGLGMRKGVSDLLLLRARHGFHGLAMELKAPGKLGTADKEQKAFLAQQQAEGWLSCLCDDPVAAWSLLVWYIAGPPGEWVDKTGRMRPSRFEDRIV
jgi:hypothetical protein